MAAAAGAARGFAAEDAPAKHNLFRKFAPGGVGRAASPVFG